MYEGLQTADFDFCLPDELIAQQAVEPRDSARLLHVTPSDFHDRHVDDLPDLLRAGDLLVMNDTRVIPARLYGARGAARVEVLLHKQEGPDGVWLGFARPGKRLRVGDTVAFSETFSATVLEKREGGLILFRFNAAAGDFLNLLRRYGEPPLPPYIKREDGAARADSDRYQTVYAQRDGAVAAPTAGLHFTPELLTRLDAKGIGRVTVTLHVGAGTFLPVKVEALKDHKMHAEYGEISAEAAQRINAARHEGRRIVCVGTTSLRVIESAVDDAGLVRPFAAETAIFIAPGYQFRAVDALMTNFHLPQSTLFMLVSAFMGLDRMRETYAHAIASRYRFYSYGDACLLER